MLKGEMLILESCDFAIDAKFDKVIDFDNPLSDSHRTRVTFTYVGGLVGNF